MPYILAIAFVLFNLFAQLGAATMVLLRKNITVAVGILVGVVLLQVEFFSRVPCPARTHHAGSHPPL